MQPRLQLLLLPRIDALLGTLAIIPIIFINWLKFILLKNIIRQKVYGPITQRNTVSTEFLDLGIRRDAIYVIRPSAKMPLSLSER